MNTLDLQLDVEWIELINQARSLGMTIEEVKAFIETAI